MRYTTAVTLLLAGACALPPPPPPVAEFLVSAGDQTYWVRSDHSGLRIRGSPLILARTGGRYYEVYVVEIDRSFPRALFSGERVFRRELASGDSAMIYDDTTVVRLATDYRRRHPRAPILGPDDDPDDNVEVAAVGETDILNVLGPYVALEHRLSVERSDEHDTDDTTRAVIDLRDGKPVALDRMLRDSTVQEAAGEGGLSNRRWRHDGYDVISHYDSTRKANALAMRDHRGREWNLGMVASSYVQIFWLDKPKVDARTRLALVRAFNDATAYGERIQQVSRKKPQRLVPAKNISRTRTADMTASKAGRTVGVTGSKDGARPVSETQHETAQLMMPQHANVLGHVFGGVVLSMMDTTAAVSAIRHARLACVTVSVDRVDFREPIHVGDLVIMKSSVNFVGRTSMEIGVRVETENLLTGVRRHTNSCYLTFVAVDRNRKPVPVPKLKPETPGEIRRYQAAKERRERRLQERISEGRS